jgi:hypothetical protein
MAGPPLTASPKEPTMFCRKCLYPLDGLAENRCPKCGGAFDPVDRQTYLREAMPPIPWQCTWALRFALGILLVGPIFTTTMVMCVDSTGRSYCAPPWERGILFILLAICTLLALILGIAGVSRRGLYHRKRGWLALVIAAIPFAGLLMFLFPDASLFASIIVIGGLALLNLIHGIIRVTRPRLNRRMRGWITISISAAVLLVCWVCFRILLRA